MNVKKQTVINNTPQEPYRFIKRIGSTNYRVTVRFSSTSRETMNDKILRLIKNDAILEKAVGE